MIAGFFVHENPREREREIDIWVRYETAKYSQRFAVISTHKIYSTRARELTQQRKKLYVPKLLGPKSTPSKITPGPTAHQVKQSRYKDNIAPYILLTLTHGLRYKHAYMVSMDLLIITVGKEEATLRERK